MKNQLKQRDLLRKRKGVQHVQEGRCSMIFSQGQQ